MKVGIDIGGSHIALGLIDDQNKIVEKYEKDFTEDDKKNITVVIEEFIVDNVKKLEKNNDIEYIGIAIPGTVKNGVIVKAINLGIYDYDIAKSLQEKINKRIFIRNDNKCACLAEYNNMIRKDKHFEGRNMLFLGIGTGIGSGMIYNGELLRGSEFEGTEVGHMIIKENGLQCKCGKKGCFERYGSILSFKNKVKERLNISQEINGEALRNIMDARINEFEDIRKKYIDDLCLGISNLINIFEPDVIVIGGGFAHFGYMFVKEIKEKLLTSSLLFNKRDSIDIRIAELSNDAGMLGAVLLNMKDS